MHRRKSLKNILTYFFLFVPIFVLLGLSEYTKNILPIHMKGSFLYLIWLSYIVIFSHIDFILNTIKLLNTKSTKMTLISIVLYFTSISYHIYYIYHIWMIGYLINILLDILILMLTIVPSILVNGHVLDKLKKQQQTS